MGADEIAHVLDQAEHRHVDLAEHVEALARIQQRDVLGRRDDHRAGQRHRLRHGQLGIAGAGRHVDDQDVQAAPVDVAQHLGQGALHHGAAPDHRCFLVDHETDRHHLDPVIDHGIERLAVRGVRLARDRHHPRHRRPVDIGIEQADRPAERRHGHGQVGCRRRLADPALARGHRDNVVDAVEGESAVAPRLGCPRRRGDRAGPGGRRLVGRPVGGQHRRHRDDTGQGGNRFFGLLSQRLERGTPFRIDFDGEQNVAIADGQARDHAQRDDVVVPLRIANGPQCGQNVVLGCLAHG